MRVFAVVFAVMFMLTGCVQKSNSDTELCQEEKEIQAVRKWFSNSMNDEDEFTDTKEYQYYARTLGLEKEAFLCADMWEVFYNPDININRDIDEKSY